MAYSQWGKILVIVMGFVGTFEPGVIAQKGNQFMKEFGFSMFRNFIFFICFTHENIKDCPQSCRNFIQPNNAGLDI